MAGAKLLLFDPPIPILMPVNLYNNTEVLVGSLKAHWVTVSAVGLRMLLQSLRFKPSPTYSFYQNRLSSYSYAPLSIISCPLVSCTGQ